MQTKTLKTTEEDSILKKISALEMMRHSISDYTNISKETQTLKKN